MRNIIPWILLIGLAGFTATPVSADSVGVGEPQQSNSSTVTAQDSVGVGNTDAEASWYEYLLGLVSDESE